MKSNSGIVTLKEAARTGGMAILAGLAGLIGLLISSGAVHTHDVSRNDVVNIVFIGDSITEGDYLPKAPPAFCVDWLRQRAPGVHFFFSNQGKSGHTTVDVLPVANIDFPQIEKAATQLQAEHQGRLIFSVMLGTNDSAMDGTRGAPLSPESYRWNLATIVDRLLADYPGSTVILNRPLWYSPNTDNGTRYLAEGLDRLGRYFPVIEGLVSQYDKKHPGQVRLGDTQGYDFFMKEHLTYFWAEDGRQGTFYLHPNLEGAKVLGSYWGRAILPALPGVPVSESR